MPHIVHKGKRGEVDFCKWLFDNLNIEVERNYNQSQGGADIDTEHFLFEIKRHETLNLENWWYQVSIAKKKHKNENIIPIVAFRQNRKPWEFLLPASLISGPTKGFIRLQEKVFLEFAKFVVEK